MLKERLLTMNTPRQLLLSLLVGIATTPVISLRLLANVGRVQPERIREQMVHRPLKLPVWPVWGGVVAQIFDWLGQSKAAQAIITNIGGRVVPITLQDLDVSPFLLLAHHSHSFTPFDPFRAATKFFLPEGFPAHPHSGFDTVTICLTGGLRHRDSESIKMKYGDGDVQWMRAGRGVIHEEMWDVPSEREYKRIEIFQLWVNLPRSSKRQQPAVHHLKNNDIPVCDVGEGVTLKLISGSLSCGSSSGGESSSSAAVTSGPGTDIAESPVNIMYLVAGAGKDVSLGVTDAGECTMTVYVRSGSLLAAGEEVRAGDLVVYRLSPGEGAPASVCLSAGGDGLEALVLTGEPLREPVLWTGPLVQADQEGLARSARVFNSIGRGSYWEHTISDAEWREHCRVIRLQDVITAVENDLV
jgi:redox-sensitive bicupin YhaK (pirin superfamily)